MRLAYAVEWWRSPYLQDVHRAPNWWLWVGKQSTAATHSNQLILKYLTFRVNLRYATHFPACLHPPKRYEFKTSTWDAKRKQKPQRTPTWIEGFVAQASTLDVRIGCYILYAFSYTYNTGAFPSCSVREARNRSVYTAFVHLDNFELAVRACVLRANFERNFFLPFLHFVC